MEITPEALNEFREIWREDHPNEPIDDKRLKEAAIRVLMAVEAVYRRDNNE